MLKRLRSLCLMLLLAAFLPTGGIVTPICPQGTAFPDGCATAPAGVAQFPHLLDLQVVTALNVPKGSGYIDGTGYAWTSSGGGCTVNASGTINVVGGSLVVPANGGITNPGAGCTSRPIIPVPAGAGGGTGGSIVPTVYQVRPPWNVAGVDYHVGVPAGITLQNVTTATLPNCATFNATTHLVSVRGNNCTLDSLEFCVGNAVGITLSTPVINLTITRNHFCQGTNLSRASCTSCFIINVSAGVDNFVIKYNEFDGTPFHGTSCHPGTCISGAWWWQPRTSGTTGPLAQYNWYHDLDEDAEDLGNPGYTADTSQFNLYVNLGDGAGAHADIHQYCGTGTVSNSLISFNTGVNFFANTQAISTWTPNQMIALHAQGVACGGSAQALQNQTITNNVFISPGTQNSIGTHGSAQTSAGVVGFYVDSGSTEGGAVVNSNYIDYSGGFFFYNTSDSPGVSSSGNLNLLTGGACTYTGATTTGAGCS